MGDGGRGALGEGVRGEGQQKGWKLDQIEVSLDDSLHP